MQLDLASAVFGTSKYVSKTVDCLLARRGREDCMANVLKPAEILAVPLSH